MATWSMDPAQNSRSLKGKRPLLSWRFELKLVSHRLNTLYKNSYIRIDFYTQRRKCGVCRSVISYERGGNMALKVSYFTRFLFLSSSRKSSSCSSFRSDVSAGFNICAILPLRVGGPETSDFSLVDAQDQLFR